MNNEKQKVAVLLSLVALWLGFLIGGPQLFAQTPATGPVGALKLTQGPQVFTGQKVFSDPASFDGGVLLSDGTAALPAWTFLLDRDNGPNRSAANTIAWSLGGTNRYTMGTGSFSPVTDNVGTLGDSTHWWNLGYFQGLARGGEYRIRFTGSTSANTYFGEDGNNSTAVAHKFGNVTALTVDDSMLFCYSPNSTLNASNYRICADKSGVILLESGGSDPVLGVATLVAGTVTVNTTAIETGDEVFYSRASGGTPANYGFPYTSAIVADTSFTITSTNAADNGNVNWVIHRGM